jgi:N-acetylneuraminic acid mutarotase
MKDEWTFLAPMKFVRYGHAVAVLDDRIYVMGGYGGVEGSLSDYMDAVESYCPKADCWLSVASMRDTRFGFGVGVLNGKLYVVGGFNGKDSWMRRVECYDPSKACWMDCAPLKTGRRYHSVAVVQGLIYAVGGYDGLTNLTNVECYDPVANQWSSAASLNCARSGHSTKVIKDQIYVVGGNVMAPGGEFYDVKTQRWYCEGRMETFRASHTVA